VENAASDFAFIFFILIPLRSANRCSSVSAATTLHSGRQGICFQILSGVEILMLSTTSKLVNVTIQLLIQWVLRTTCPGYCGRVGKLNLLPKLRTKGPTPSLPYTSSCYDVLWSTGIIFSSLTFLTWYWCFMVRYDLATCSNTEAFPRKLHKMEAYDFFCL
jgi:hypothetical protein